MFLLFLILFTLQLIYSQQNPISAVELKEQELYNFSLNKDINYPEVSVSMSYDNEALFIKGIVRKINFKDGERSWRYGDGFYINFVTPDSNEEEESDKFYGFGFSLINKKPVAVVVNKDGEYFPNILPPLLPKISVDSSNNIANYEITIPWKNVYPFHPIKNNLAGINIVYISQSDDGSRIIQQLIEDNYDTELTNKRKFLPVKFIPSFKNDIFITGEIENRITDKNNSNVLIFIYSPKQRKENIIIELKKDGKLVYKKTHSKNLKRGINEFLLPIKLPKEDGLFSVNASLGKSTFWQDSLYKFSNIKLHHTFSIIKLLSDSTNNGQINFSGNTLSYHYNELVSLLSNFNSRKEISIIKDKFDNLYSLADHFVNEKSLFSNSGYLEAAFLSGIDSTLQPFSLIIPSNFDINKSYVLVTALHGSGVDEVGFIKNLSKTFNAKNIIIAAPRGRNLSSWYCGDTEKDILYMIQYLKSIINIEYNIAYGFSMGGYGVWRLGLLYPDFFNGGIVISGIPFNPRESKDEYDMNNYYSGVKNKIPFLVVHGNNDKSLNFSYTDDFIKKLISSGYNIDFEIIEGGGHGNFNTSDIMLDWLQKLDFVTTKN